MNRLPETIRAVLFDLDGTLIETHIDFPAMKVAMEEMVAAAHIPTSVTDGKDILGMVQASCQMLTARGEDAAVFRRQAFQKLEELEVRGCAHPLLLPQVVPTLQNLAERGVRVGIVTRNCRRVSEGMLARFSVPHDLLLTRDDVPRTKPDPQHLWDALQILGEEPAHAVMVGDHWMDIQAGRDAGCVATVGILGRNETSWFAPCPPDILIRDMGDFSRLLISE